MSKTIAATVLLGGFFFASNAFGQSDSQEISLTDTYDSQDISSFKQRAILNVAAQELAFRATQPDVASTVEATLSSFRKRMNKKLRAELQQALVHALTEPASAAPKTESSKASISAKDDLN